MPAFRPDLALYPFASRWLESRVGRVHYVDEGAGRPVFLLHGNPAWSFLYRGIVTRLRDRFRCVAVDYPGFGLSVRPAGYGYTPAERADRVTGLVMGNTWFWPIARTVGKVFSLVMSSPPMQWAILERNWFVEGLIPKGTARDLTEREMDHYRAVQPDREARAGVAEFPSQLRKAGPWLARLQRAVRRELADRPLLLPWGMQDFAFPPDSTLPRWRATFADARLVLLEGAKHFIQEDAPAEIADAIAERFRG